ncbi:PAS domain S-box protein [Uliginosibacterium paludis]|uniref:PAS domain S-box protein n=1 Tax=Uliginosibacterium paludis TaxID=1615952 RepID=A0ABV2CLM1_9RHOO
MTDAASPSSPAGAQGCTALPATRALRRGGERKPRVPSSDDLAELLQGLPQPMLRVSASMHVTPLNAACEQILKGALLAEGWAFDDLPWRFDATELAPRVQTAIHLGKGFSQELAGEDGRWLRLVVTPRRMPDAERSSALMVFEDLTAMRRIERELQDYQTRYASLFEFSPDGFVVLDPEAGLVLECNGAAERMLGVAGEQVVGRSLFDLLPPEQAEGRNTRAVARQHMREALEKGSHHFEWVRRRPDGTDLWTDVMASVVHRGGRRLLLATWRDICERKQMEAQLLENRKHLMLATQAAELGVWVRDLATNRLQFDERQHEIYQSPEAVRRSGADYDFWRSRVHPDDIEAVEATLRNAVLTAHNVSTQFRILWPDGSVRHIQSAAIVVRDDNGLPVRLVGVNRDLTEQVEAAEALRENERRFRQVAESLPQLVWTCAPDGPCDYLSPQWVRYTGVAESLQLGFGWLEQIHPEDRQRTIDHWNATAARGADFMIEFRIRRHDGVYRWFRTLALPMRDVRDRIVKWFGSNTDIEDIKLAQAMQQEVEARLDRMIDLMPEAVLLVDESGRIEKVNQRAEEIFRYARSELLGQSIEVLVPLGRREAHREMRAQFIRTTTPRQMGVGRELHARRRDGSEFPVEAGLAPFQEGDRRYVIVSVADCTVRIQAEEELRLAANVFDNTLDGILIALPDLTITKVNPAFEQILGYSREEIRGRALKDLQSDRHDAAFFDEMRDTLRQTGSWQGEIWQRRKDGRVVPLWINISSMRDDAGRLDRYIATLYDITEQKVSQERINYLAHYDVLTDIPNRTLFADRLRHAVQNAARGPHRLALIFIDIDNFKQVNDTLGHTAGDALLCIVAERIKASTRQSDTVGRLGGDEFLVLIENVEQQLGFMQVAQKILEALSTPMNVGFGDFCISASMGIACYPEDGQDAGSLLKNADLAMYRAKASGKNQIHFYDAEMSASLVERMALQTELHQALDAGALQLHYQPVVDVKTRRCAGVEALVRWHHEIRGWVPPAKFIPAAEESALIHPLGAWVLRTACLQMKRWQDAGIALSFMAVNVSGKQIMQADFVALAQQILFETGCDPALITLELTESFVMHESREAIQRLERLRTLGFGIAIDDFGTGYSSLAYLKRLPVSKLKLDRSFVCDIPGDNNDAAIARAVLKLGESVGLDVVAEGVETEAQHRFLLDEGCRFSQGYLYSRPVDAESVRRLLD